MIRAALVAIWALWAKSWLGQPTGLDRDFDRLKDRIKLWRPSENP
jgi:hypothetical protein